MTATAVELLTGAQVARERERLFRGVHFAPPPRLLVSEWADRYRVLSTEASAVGGQWRSHPYQREIMDVGHDPRFRRVVAMMPSQMGKTEVLLNHVGFSVDLDPCPMLMVEPTLEMARALSKDRIDPMFRDTVRLRGKLLESGRRAKEDTILAKGGPGWRLTFVGANAPAGLAMRPIRKLFLDEPDRFPASAGEEGDPVAIAEKRTTTYPNRLIYMTGSPTLEGSSRIAKEYEASDQRRWLVPCPHCGHRQPLEWGGPDDPFGLKWDRDAAGDPVPESAAYLCGGCRTLIPERQKAAMVAAGRWEAARPGRDIAGFHFTALVSLAVPWATLVREWYDAKGSPEEMKSFVNTRLARTYVPPGQVLAVTTDRREKQPRDAEGYPVVPAEASLLVLSVDVQEDRLEVLATAWGAGEECWKLGNWRLLGDPQNPATWHGLEALRTRAWQHGAQGTIRVRITAVDSGDNTQAVCNYVRPREPAVIATKGASDYGKQIVSRPKKRSDRYKVLVWLVGTVAAKDMLFGRLLKTTDPGPGYIHFGDQVDDAFLAQLANERATYKKQGTQRVRFYERISDRPNEAIDLCVLAIAALYALGDPVRRQLLRPRSAAEAAPSAPGTPAASASAPVPAPAPSPPPAPAPRRGGSWASAW